jgi:predicted  nucleic acid-binding Zn-ribbon protein
MTKRKVTVQEAAGALDTSVDAVRQRIKRGKLQKAEPDDPADSRVYVWLDSDHTEARHEAQGEGTVNLSALVESLQDQVGYLREQLQAERQAHSEARRLLAAALERIPPQLETPPESPGGAVEASGPPDRGDPPATGGAQEGVQRPWWRRVFGG